MKIFADKGLEEGLEALLRSVCDDKECYIIQLEQKPNYNTARQSLIGIDIALELAKENIPVVILGFLSHEMLVSGDKSTQWFAAMGYANVAFCRLPAQASDISSALESIRSGNRKSDPLAIALLGVTKARATISSLHHDITYALRDTEAMTRWENNARTIFGDKEQSELLSLVQTADVSDWDLAKGQFEGQIFPDVCIDIEGTILDSNGNVRHEVLTLAQQKANGGPITVWTGGDVESLSKQLRKAGILWKIISKQTMRGASVRMIIDDQPEASFRSGYGVGYQEYIQV